MMSVDELKACRFFLVFGDAELEKIAQVTEKKKYTKGDVVYRNGDAAQKFFIVQKGLVSLREFQPGDAVGIAFETRGPGELFGVASLMPTKAYTLTALCQEDTELYEVNVKGLEEIIQWAPSIGYILMKEVAHIYFDRYRLCKRQLYQMVKTPTLITALPG
ncbi:MAG: cyclic nucleotide-binding domain-containing protein [Desulfosoma sp.]